MSTDINSFITSKVASHTLHFFSPGEGYEGGHFSDALFTLMAKADRANLTKIAEGFPAEVAAFELARTSATGLAALRILSWQEVTSA
jgi:hypothetical protein